MNGLVSIIVPVYNVERYLSKCIESILMSEYKEYEVILVDDGSTDSSGKMCDSWRKIDSRIKVIHKKNGGLSSARNAGLNVAKGEYILFVDSDDYIDNKLLQVCVNCIEKYDVDMVQFNYYRVDEAYHIIGDIAFCEQFKVIENNDSREMLYKESGKNIVVNAWNKLFKKKIINNTRFVEGRNYEDNMFLSDIIDKEPKVLLIPHKLYYYLIRKDSITTSSFNEKKLDRIYAMDYILNKHKKDTEIYKYVSYWKVSVLFQLYYEIYNCKNYDRNILLKDLKQEFNKTFVYCKFYNKCLLKFGMFYLFPKVFCRIYKEVFNI
ncbi:MAG: glycosyltransferase family 2 protein [Wujia sp.]